MTTAEATATWTDICALDDLFPGNPVGAMLGKQQIALVRYDRERIYAIANFDPFSKALVLSRGIVGDRLGEPMLVSPIYKQRFALNTGFCLEDPTVRLQTYPVRVVDGRVHVGSA